MRPMRHRKSDPTPGPWEVQTQGPDEPVFISGPEPRNELLAKMLDDHPIRSWEEGQALKCANAHLMAAAPDLLGSLETILAWMGTAHSEDAMKPGDWPMIDRARAAIAKAKGEDTP